MKLDALAEALRSDAPIDHPEALLDALIDPAVPAFTKRELLLALSQRPDRGDDLRTLALAMRRRAVPVRAPRGALDTCGTGGDGSGSFNISTAAALLVSAAGVPVVKHGNRALTSRSGSADLLDALRVPLASDAARAEQQLEHHGFTFLFAPHFHPATRAIGPLRKELGIRTAFNLLGPLTNPAAPDFQLVGAATASAGRALADALSGMPIVRAFVVHGAPDWDEATPVGTFLRWDVTPGRVTQREIDPLFTYGVQRCEPEALAGGDGAFNAALLSDLFGGARGGLRDAVLLNAALALELVRDLSPRAAFDAAADTIDSGRARWRLERLLDAPPTP